MNNSLAVPEDSILKRHFEQMQAAAKTDEPEDSILRRHYRQMQESASAAPSSAVLAEADTVEVVTKPAATEPTPAPAPTKPVAAPTKPVAAPSAEATPEPGETPAFAEPSEPPSGGFFSRLFRKLFGG